MLVSVTQLNLANFAHFSTIAVNPVITLAEDKKKLILLEMVILLPLEAQNYREVFIKAHNVILFNPPQSQVLTLAAVDVAAMSYQHNLPFIRLSMITMGIL